MIIFKAKKYNKVKTLFPVFNSKCWMDVIIKKPFKEHILSYSVNDFTVAIKNR